MKRMITIIAVAFLATGAIQAQTLHLIDFNPMDKSIDTETDDERIMRVAQEVAGVIDYGFDGIRYVGDACNKDNLTKELEALRCGKDDIILFYYSGHGSRSTGDKSEYPQICLTETVPDRWVAMHIIVEKLQAKNARLTLVFSDCCNRAAYGVSPKSPLAAAKSPLDMSKSERLVKNYRRLFLDNRGLVVATSSKKGQVSYPLVEKRKDGTTVNLGGNFSYVLFDCALQWAAEGTIDATWQSILTETSKKMESISEELKIKQEPYYEVKIQGTANTVRPTPQQGFSSSDNAFAKALSALLDKSRPTEWRLDQAEQLAARYFAAGAMVATVARNGSTVIDHESARDFLRRIASSKFIKQVNIIKESADEKGLRTSIKVQEIRETK